MCIGYNYIFHSIIFMAIFLPQTIIKLLNFEKNTWTQIFKIIIK